MSGVESGRLATVRSTVIERPGLVLVGALGALLAVDLLFRLAGFRLFVGPVGLLGGQLTVERLLTLVWNGVVVGLGIGLAGIGLSMTYSILRFANFAHGDYITSGAFAGWAVAWLIAGVTTGNFAGNLGGLLLIGETPSAPSSSELGINVLGTPLAILAGLVVAGVFTVALALAIDRVVYRPMRDAGGIALLIASIGVALALRYAIVFMFGGANRGLTAGGGKLILAGVNGKLALAGRQGTLTAAREGTPPDGAFYLELPLVDLGAYSTEVLSVTGSELTLVGLSLALMLGLHLLLQRTKLGTAMRATADNQDLARVTGIPTERVIRATWVVGAGLAGASGFLLALERGTLSFNLGWLLLLLIFAAVILGGIGSIYGAIAGGILIGLTNSMSLVWIPSSLSTAAAFLIMIFVLLLKPDGLFGGVTTA